ncbi:S16 family serine protease, partial [Komagataeibacter swingsii]|uniref:S16 family serine protease n=1 Tax=Komagataeibacter swingsii TaxID=215220 RepID=UPI00272EAB9C
GDPAADMAVAAALVSAATGQPTSAGSVYFGEVGLSGEIRQVSQPDTRLKEAHKLGFEQAFLPRRIARGNRKPTAPDGLGIQEIGHLGDLVSLFTGAMEEAGA